MAHPYDEWRMLEAEAIGTTADLFPFSHSFLAWMPATAHDVGGINRYLDRSCLCWSNNGTGGNEE
jgi:hypothetical protein